MSPSSLLLLTLLGADPEVSRTIAEIATSAGELRAAAVRRYVAGCRGKSRFVWRNNAQGIEALKPVFSDGDAKVRLAALGLLDCYSPETFETELLALIDDKDDEVRERAFGEAAHRPSSAVAAALATSVEACQGRLDEIAGKAAHWCVFSLYALAEQGKSFKGDKPMQKRIADLSAPFSVAKQAKLREHAVRNIELYGTADHVAALGAIIRGEGKAGGEPITDAERAKARTLAGKLKKRK